MPFHQVIQRLLLLGVRLDQTAAPPIPSAPRRLQPLIESLMSAHREFDARAIRYGHRYRSGFWGIYLLSALAVLCAMMPLALGWDSTSSFMQPFAVAWIFAEITVIGAVGMIYWRGHRSDWQGEWLRARTVAELTSYLPLVAPLVDFSTAHGEHSWYLRVLNLDQRTSIPGEVAELCQRNERRARELLEQAWSDTEFVSAYGEWATGVLLSQQAYHTAVAARSHALQHRIHRVTVGLFALTALAALAHLVIHSRWLSLITTVFPTVAASLHGALAQSEAYRLHAASERIARELQTAVDEIRGCISAESHASRAEPLKTATRSAIALILEEHQDWHMLVKPHHLPLA